MNLSKEEIKILTEEIIHGTEKIIFSNLKMFIDEVAPKLNTKEELMVGLSAWLEMSIEKCEAK